MISATVGLIFDFDDTLTRTEKLKKNIISNLFSKYFKVRKQVVKKFIENNPTDSRYTLWKKFKRRFFQRYAKKNQGHFLREMDRLVLQTLMTKKIEPTTIKILQYLKRKGTKLFIVSQSNPRIIKNFLLKEKAIQYFDEIYGNIGNKNKTIRELIQKNKISRTKCIFIGDSKKDLISACELNIFFIGVGKRLLNYKMEKGRFFPSLNKSFRFLQFEVGKKLQTAIVTGGGRGIGQSVALQLSEQGINTVIVSRTQKELEKTAALARKNGSVIYYYKCDIANARGVSKLFKKVKKRFGSNTILINNAGIGIKIGPLYKWTPSDIDKLVRTNLQGTLYCTRESIRLMKSLKSPGIIINIASKTAFFPVKDMAAYSASKAAIISLTSALAQEEPTITFVSICPGRVDTKLYRAHFKKSSKKIIKPEEVAEQIVKIILNYQKVRTGSIVKLF